MSSEIQTISALVKQIRELILAARKAAAQAVDRIQVATCFEIGRRIVEHEQQGAHRAEYGKALLIELAASLKYEFGRGFSRSNLQSMRKFYLTYRDRLPEKCQMPSGKLAPKQKSQTLSDLLPTDYKTWKRYITRFFPLSAGRIMSFSWELIRLMKENVMKLKALTAKLAEQFSKGVELEKTIREILKGIGYELCFETR